MYLTLDIGNVIVDVNFNEFIKALFDTHELSEQEVWDILVEVQPNHDLAITKLADCLKNQHNIDVHKFPGIMEAWDRSITVNTVSIQHIENMLSKGVQIALLSNMGAEHRKIIRSVIGPAFDRCVKHISCDVGARKPQLLFYQSFLLAQPSFTHAVYVDDRLENLHAGTGVGLKSVFLDSSKMNAVELNDRWQKITDMVLGYAPYKESLYTTT